MEENVKLLKDEIKDEIKEVKNIKQLNDLRVRFLGKKGKIHELGNLMKTIEKEKKRDAGILLNKCRNYIETIISEKQENLENQLMIQKLNEEWIDITLPSTKIKVGTIHPLTKIVDEIEELFVSMGYDVVEGPEIESDLYNFEKLNLPKDHPARDMQDSFYITKEMLLRTQTSPVQARVMDSNIEKGPIRIICPGKVYRKDEDDMTHSHQFTQIEGLVIDEGISVAHLKGTLEILVKKMFGNNLEIRYRPSYFPFTEPSLEVDVSCFKCNGKGCSICKRTGWIEILGSGMVHPNVLRACGYDPNKYSGFAFGMGPERIAMLKYGVNDIRHFYTNHIDFLNNFDKLEKEDMNETK